MNLDILNKLEEKYVIFLNKLLIIYLITFTLLSNSGCSNAGVLKLKINSQDNINLDRHGQALPLVLRCYQLEANKKFLAATFNELWKNDKKTLMEDLVISQEFLVLPNAVRTFNVKLEKNTKYVGCIGLFNSPNEDNCKIIVQRGKVLFPGEITIYIYENNLKLVEK